MTWRLLLYALVGYVALLLLVFLFQRKLLYLPSDFRFSEVDAANEGLSYWPSSDHYRGLVGREGKAPTNGTIIVFHGNAGAASHRGYYVDALAPLGLRVLLVEYPGYGGRAGRPSEEILVDDALETLRLAHRQFGEPLFLWGESLGAGVVSAVVAQTDRPLKGLVLFLPWDSLPNLAQTHYWYLPARWLVLDRYDNVTNLEGFQGNIAVVLAEDDEVVPVGHGMRLYESIRAPGKRLWRFPNARHNEMPIRPGLLWWKEVVEFVSRES